MPIQSSFDRKIALGLILLAAVALRPGIGISKYSYLQLPIINSLAQQVFYIQDSITTYDPGDANAYYLKEVMPGWTSSSKYAISLWLKKISWNHSNSGWDMIATITQGIGYSKFFDA